MNITHISTTPAGVDGHLLTVDNGHWATAMNSTDFMDGFFSSLGVVVLAELGDRTFFIAAILATKHSRAIVFFGQMAAQTAMVIASVALGMAAHFIPRYVLHYISIVCFMLFGCKMLYEARGLCMDVKESESSTHADLEQNLSSESSTRRNRRLHTLGFTTAFTMTVMAEWGDRSQIATIVLAATKDVYAVALGALVGHALCTAVAVLVGRAIAAYIPVRVLTLIGAMVFFGFAAVALYNGYDEIEDDLRHLNSTLLTTRIAATTPLATTTPVS